jgi:outer membrane protein assembly factor BamD (BamD/ComL family)
LDKAEKSLSFLKQHYSPELNSAVEENYVFLYLYRQDVVSARKQIDSFIKNFPASEKVAMLVEIRAGLD